MRSKSVKRWRGSSVSLFFYLEMQCPFFAMSLSRAAVKSCISRLKLIRLNLICGATGLTVMRDVSCCLLWFETIFCQLARVILDLEKNMVCCSKKFQCCCWKHTDGIWKITLFIIVCVCVWVSEIIAVNPFRIPFEGNQESRYCTPRRGS